MAEVISLVEAIRKLIIFFYYPENSKKWGGGYFSTILKLDKVIMAELFQINNNINTNCIIPVTIDTYGMEINNLDIKLIIWHNLSLSFDLII